MIRCIIVDDEPIARKGMKWLVDCRRELELLASLDSASAAAEFLANNDIDLIFLDIEMPEVNGLEFARRIPRDCFVVFTTAYSEYALDSYEVDAIDYLLKPIDSVRFNKAVDKAVAYASLLESSEAGSGPAIGRLDHIIVKADRRYVRIYLEDIIYVEGLKDYVIINAKDRKVVTRMTMKSIVGLLPDSMFLRVGKSYVVNRRRIDSFDGNDVFVGETAIAIGTAYRDSVMASLLGQ